MAKQLIGTIAKIAAKQAVRKVAGKASAPARASSPIPAMAIGLATSFLSKRLLPVKLAGIGGVVLAAVATRWLLDRKEAPGETPSAPAPKRPKPAQRATAPSTRPAPGKPRKTGLG